jgi:hypothetical protein
MAALPNKVQIIKTRYQAAYKIKEYWMTIWQLVGEYVMTRKQNFLTTNLPGEFLTEQLFSSAAPEANRTMASAIVGNMWPNGGRSFKITRPRNISDSQDVKDYYETITDVLSGYMDQPEAGLARSLSEYMLDQGAFGISGVHVKKTGDYFSPLRYKAINVKQFTIEENKDGEIDTIFIDDKLTIRQIVDEYGIDQVSEKTRKLYNEAGDLNAEVRVLVLLEPRRAGRYGFGNKNLPFASIHIEYDANKILRESGFSQAPAIVARFLKALGETYGRSPAMFALPAILRLNVAWELVMRAGEKQLSPPLYLLDNGALGGGTVDTSSGGLTVFNTTGMGDKAPIGPLYDVGDMRPMLEIIQQLIEDVSKAFYIDRLVDLNNETKMTFGEAQIRDRIRGEGLNSVFRIQEAEMFSPLIKTSFNFLLEEGLLGVAKGSEQERNLLARGLAPIYIPPPVLKAIQQGQKVYDIKYISPASRIMRMEEFQGLTQSLDVTMALSGVLPEIVDYYDPKELVRKLHELTGTDESVLRATEVVKQIQALRAEQAQQARQVQMTQIGADVNMKTAQAQSMQQGAISGRPRG